MICFSRDNIIIIFFPDKNLLLCAESEELGPLVAECVIYLVYSMGKWREGERQKVYSKMSENLNFVNFMCLKR